MSKLIINALIVLVLFSFGLNAQNNKVNECLRMVAEGRVSEVKMMLPDLLVEYPDDPGVQLVHAVVLDDAYKAIEKYKMIISKYPESPWADDAYWRIIQFYAVLGDTTQAQSNLTKLRQNYPSSEYLAPASDVVASSVRIARMGTKSVPAPQPTAKPAAVAATPASPATPAKTEEKKPEVKPDAAKADPSKASPAAKPSANTSYGLQVGIYKTKDKAVAEKNNFLKMRLRTEVYDKVVDGETMYAVVVGNYSSKQAAESAKDIVEQQCKCKPIVFEKEGK
jgi:cell division septation protein DedD